MYSPKSSQSEDSKTLCNSACVIGKDSCVAQCSKTPTATECTTACDVGFSSCNSECQKTEPEAAGPIEKLKEKFIK